MDLKSPLARGLGLRLYLPVLLILALLLSILVAEIAAYSCNTLRHRPDWRSGKRLLASSIMGSIASFDTRHFFSRNRLNLGEWYGFNEFLPDRLFRPSSVRFRMNVADGAYLYVLFNRTRHGFTGIRLSRHTGFPSRFFRADPGGRFTFIEPIPDLSLEPGWQTARLSFDNGRVGLRIDGRWVGELDEPAEKRQVIAFRSGQRPVAIDDVVAVDDSGDVVIDESFRNGRLFRIFLVPVFVLIAACLGVAGLAGKLLRADRKRLFFGIVLVLMTCIAASAVYYAFDYRVWSERYHLAQTEQWKLVEFLELNRFEKLRRFLFRPFHALASAWPGSAREESGLEALLGASPKTEFDSVDLKVVRGGEGGPVVDVIDDRAEAIRDYLGRRPFVGGTTILLLGTSQMWGTGAWRVEDRIAVRLHERLSAREPRANLYLVNASQRGGNSRRLLERYREHLHRFEPDLVLVDLSNNDSDPRVFGESLRSMVRQANQNDSEILFVLEPNSVESDTAWLEAKHEIMRKVARQTGTPCIDLHAYLAGPGVYDSGILWWDAVHLTSYGQKLAAEFLAREMASRATN
jgi:lysophospholipase L1-like esterase